MILIVYFNSLAFLLFNSQLTIRTINYIEYPG
jgi:hypothetical protein